MAEFKTILTLNQNINNEEDLLQRYKKSLDRIFDFKPYLIGDKTIQNYYKFCVEQDIEVDQFMQIFDIHEDKQSFITRANHVIEESKSDYLRELEKNTELTMYISYDEYTRESIKKLYSFISVILGKENKSLDIKFYVPENGLNKSDLQNLLDLSEILEQDLVVLEHGEQDAGVPLSKVIKAYGEMNDFVDKINSLNLSPFEKFLLVHDYAANRIYKHAESDHLYWNAEKSRSFVNVMTSDTIVCAGYAQIVKEFCKRLGIECEYIAGTPLDELYDEQGFSTNATGHAANIVHIVDEKYGINGYYFCDACWDSKQSADQINRNYFYAALPIQDIDGIGQAKYFSKTVSRMDIPKTSEPIPIGTFRKALNEIYSSESQVEEDLQRTVKSAYNLCAIKSENDFMQEYYRQRDEHTLS